MHVIFMQDARLNDLWAESGRRETDVKRKMNEKIFQIEASAHLPA